MIIYLKIFIIYVVRRLIYESRNRNLDLV